MLFQIVILNIFIICMKCDIYRLTRKFLFYVYHSELIKIEIFFIDYKNTMKKFV